MYNGRYPGLSRPKTEKMNHQCSIIIEKASAMDEGLWICQIYLKEDKLVVKRNVVITGKHL